MLGACFLFAVAATLTTAVGCTGGTARRSDPPVLIPWSRIGDIVLGEPRKRVEAEYGSEGHRYHALVENGGIIQGYYRLHGSRVSVTFQDGLVNEIEFTTPYYRTTTGFGIGSRVPLGRCHRTAAGRCDYRWHGFVRNAWGREEPCHCWVKVGRGARSLPATVDNFLKPWTFIFTRHGRVTEIYFALKFVD